MFWLFKFEPQFGSNQTEALTNQLTLGEASIMAVAYFTQIFLDNLVVLYFPNKSIGWREGTVYWRVLHA